MSTLPVDELAFSGCWLGLVVPKRHAKRAVTRTLLKRRIRAAVGNACGLPAGMWVVRLRSPFSRTEFVSAASDRLDAVVSDELATLMTAAVVRARR
jgi:ribonuclease P protein component